MLLSGWNCHKKTIRREGGKFLGLISVCLLNFDIKMIAKLIIRVKHFRFPVDPRGLEPRRLKCQS